MTTDDVRQRLAGRAESEAIGIAITELDARDREIAQLCAESDRLREIGKHNTQLLMEEAYQRYVEDGCAIEELDAALNQIEGGEE